MKPENVSPKEQDAQQHVHSFTRQASCGGHIEHGLIFHHHICRCGALATKHHRSAAKKQKP